jgi:thioredoxin reductase (NADPH)
MSLEKLIIIGSGPAGYTAALYAARANLKPLLFEGFFSGPAGGQLMTTTEVENYPGFPAGITGPELMKEFRDQAERFGTRYLQEDVVSCDLSQSPFKVVSKSGTYEAECLIIATGATAKRLDIKGTRDGEFWNRGVSACAVCDGAAPLFREKSLFVVGGGDSAVEEAVFLTHYASRVYIVHRRDELRASKIMIKRALSHPKVEVLWNSVVDEVKGGKVVESVVIKNVKTGALETMPAGGLFFAVGHLPNTAFLNGQIELHPNDYIKVVPGTAKTSRDGVFAAGDVQDFNYRQAVTAAGSGCMAALEAERWLAARE